MSSATAGVAVAVSSDRRAAPDPPRGVGEEEIIRAEVVTPLRDAVRLVDHKQPDPDLPDELCEPRRGERSGAT